MVLGISTPGNHRRAIFLGVCDKNIGKFTFKDVKA
jgi:hypothetical protein